MASSYALDIAFTGPDPDEAVRIANAYAKLYTTGSLSQKQAESKAANAMIAQRLETLRVQAQAADAAEQRYRMQNNLPSTQGLSLTEQEISSYNTQVAESRAQAAEDQARLATAQAQLRSGSAGDDVGEALGSSVVSDLRGEQARLASEVAQLTTRYGTRHPDVQRAKNQLATIDRRIAEEIRRVISNLTAKARVSQQRLASLTGTLQTAQSSLANNNAALVGLNDLVQRNATAKSLYESYLTKYQEQIARLGTEQADASVLQYASDPGGPVSLNLFLNMLLALTLGVGLGLAAAFVTEMTFPGITTGDEVEQRLGVNYLGSVPLIESVMKTSDSPAIAVVSEPRSAFAESIRSLRASIQFATSTPPRVIAITSALPQEGKTTISICLARSMGQSGERVVLVDCDLRRHGVSRFLRADADRPGLIKVLRGEATLEQALVPDSATGMMVLPVARGDDFDTELMIGEKMDALLEQLKARFDVVVLDTAPVRTMVFPGSLRAPKIAIIGAMGIIGLTSFTAYLIHVFKPLRLSTYMPSDDPRISVSAAAAWACVAEMMTAVAGSPTPDPGPSLAIFACVALGLRALQVPVTSRYYTRASAPGAASAPISAPIPASA